MNSSARVQRTSGLTGQALTGVETQLIDMAQTVPAAFSDIDRIAEMAAKRNTDPGKLYASLQKSGRLKEIEHGITEERVFSWLLERNS